MKHRFRFLGQYAQSKEDFIWTITESELHHLHSVLRLSVGDIIEVFDGHGFYSLAEIKEISPKKQALALSDQLCFEEKSQKNVALAIGALKPKTLDDLIPSLVELGLNEIHIFSQQHTEKFRLSDKNQERWEKIILASTKQCKRNYLTKLSLWPKKKTFEEHMTKSFDRIFMLSPKGENHLIEEKDLPKNACAVIGSESGLSEEEMAFFESIGAKKVTLNKNILRAYTAAIATAALLKSLEK